MSTSDKKMVTLKSCDGESFEVDEAVAMQMQTIRHMMEDDCATEFIPLPNVKGRILSKIIEYCKHHVKGDEKAKAFEAGEFMEVDMETLHELLMAANYLDIKGLLDLSCQTVADMIKGKSPEEIRKIFNIKNDFTPEEEEKIRKENAWAFEE